MAAPNPAVVAPNPAVVATNPAVSSSSSATTVPTVVDLSQRITDVQVNLQAQMGTITDSIKAMHKLIEMQSQQYTQLIAQQHNSTEQPPQVPNTASSTESTKPA